MREIEFRFWSSTGKMLEWKELRTLHVSTLFDESVRDRLMQFTGLNDKKGVKIFEGDVISWGENIETVYFNDGMFQTETSCIDSCMEVIGNIHQHEHLLEKK